VPAWHKRRRPEQQLAALHARDYGLKRVCRGTHARRRCTQPSLFLPHLVFPLRHLAIALHKNYAVELALHAHVLRALQLARELILKLLHPLWFGRCVLRGVFARRPRFAQGHLCATPRLGQVRFQPCAPVKRLGRGSGAHFPLRRRLCLVMP
jgi:hypothetical protein